ncbi:hypothetical protein SCHIN_v1c01860 [Spiroplasma chinense]|uniref:HMA domain-containing protein n=1 Tax=Spiroplasma chinense TaxID=216932 RepID=A0A5B9Y2X0_9MOLU|nr:heavy-metal-associated domain-containing protein [Spiroplasma chinense]QEH61384.1 hypothetical protein SCHIN_v1c01860 [Spiroplasma chinense]
MQTIKLEVKEIKCQGCANKIIKSVKKIKGVKNIEVNVEAKIVDIEFDNVKASIDKITDAIGKLNYNPVMI